MLLGMGSSAAAGRAVVDHLVRASRVKSTELVTPRLSTKDTTTASEVAVRTLTPAAAASPPGWASRASEAETDTAVGSGSTMRNGSPASPTTTPHTAHCTCTASCEHSDLAPTATPALQYLQCGSAPGRCAEACCSCDKNDVQQSQIFRGIWRDLA